MFKYLKQLFCNHMYDTAIYRTHPRKSKRQPMLMAFAKCQKCGKQDFFMRKLDKA